MRLEPKIHCGTVLSCRATEEATYTETAHAAGTCLETHAHSKPHLAILLQGAYFERIGDECFLRLPGDSVFYPGLLVHENRFGRLPSRCMNVETRDDLRPLDPPRTELQPVVDMIARGEAQSLGPVAKAVGFSAPYLARRFRREFGMSIGDFAKRTRIQKSARLFFSSELSLAEIALECGYYDQSHCTNEFAHVAGFTPGELRRLADH